MVTESLTDICIVFCVYSRAVNIFKEDLNLSQFSASCGPLTLAFKTISEKIRQVELKLATPCDQEAVVEVTQHSLGMGLGLKSCATQIRQIQLLEKSHLEKRVVINDKLVKLAKLDYDLKK